MTPTLWIHYGALKSAIDRNATLASRSSQRMSRWCLLFALCSGACGGNATSDHRQATDDRSPEELCVAACELFRSGSQATECPDPLGNCEEDCESEDAQDYRCWREHTLELECLVVAGSEFSCVNVGGEQAPVFDRDLPECEDEVEAFFECVCSNYDVCE
jgi:hypothetical protein